MEDVTAQGSARGHLPTWEECFGILWEEEGYVRLRQYQQALALSADTEASVPSHLVFGLTQVQ